MENWPTVPLIRIIRGKYRQLPVENVVAVKTSKGGCYMEAGGGRDFSPNRDSDYIFEWEEMNAVPNKSLESLRQAFRGADVAPDLGEAILEVTAFANLTWKEALEKAVTPCKTIYAASGITEELAPDDRISTTLDSINRVSMWGGDLGAPLALVARIASSWADLEGAGGGALDEIIAQAEYVDSTSVPGLSDLIQSFSTITEDVKNNSEYLRDDLIHLGSLAVVWAAKMIQDKAAREA